MKIDLTAQGFSTVVDTEAFPQETRDKWLEYGARRWFQDSINAAAHKLREAGESVDAEALFKGRNDAAMAAEFGSRGAGATGDPLDKYRLQVVRAALKSGNNEELAAEYGKIDPKDQKARNEFLLAIARDKAGVVDPAAKKRRDAEKTTIDL